jgi:hypothetical protein
VRWSLGAISEWLLVARDQRAFGSPAGACSAWSAMGSAVGAFRKLPAMPAAEYIPERARPSAHLF